MRKTLKRYKFAVNRRWSKKRFFNKFQVKDFVDSEEKPVPIDMRIKLRQAMVTAAENIVLKDSILDGRMEELKHILEKFN